MVPSLVVVDRDGGNELGLLAVNRIPNHGKADLPIWHIHQRHGSKATNCTNEDDGMKCRAVGCRAGDVAGSPPQSPQDHEDDSCGRFFLNERLLERESLLLG